MRRLKPKFYRSAARHRRGRTTGRSRLTKEFTHNRRRRSSAATSSICASAAWRRASSVAALPRSTATALNNRDDGNGDGWDGAVGDARSAARSIVCGGGGGAGARAGVGFTNGVDVTEPGGGLGGARARGGLTGGAPCVWTTWGRCGAGAVRTGGRPLPSTSRSVISKSRGTAGATWFLYRIKISRAICSLAPPLKLGAAAQIRAVQHFSVTTLSSF